MTTVRQSDQFMNYIAHVKLALDSTHTKRLPLLALCSLPLHYRYPLCKLGSLNFSTA